MDDDGYHPDLRNMARVLPRGIFTRRTLPALRALTSLSSMRPSRGAQVSQLPGGAKVRLHPGKGGGDGAVLWIHGGGYVIGSAAQDDSLCRRLARRIGVPVVAVDYRLAPRHPYPAALEDCYDAFRWLTRMPEVDPSRVVVAGASAGGGLAAALALLARDRGRPTPLFQLLVYPMLDDRSDAIAPDSRYRLWNENTNRLGWHLYLSGADPQRAAPARRSDLEGLPPAWIGVGTVDPLFVEDQAYARNLTRAGVPCEFDTVEGAFHGFDMVAPSAGVSRDFFDRQCRAVRAALDS
ncbi:alpha/beta hydrolase [Mycobacterium yunnanensis]|uniref:Alpha/beta hydrolase n=1 Tax=Mycobacterium yunnanensis TaxID=368477 RepID=A0A9X2YQI6_9MYCO|nr:alpha/beta hydrolase [Mycobacterium yunnanensis]MCV7423777.1 alpha/beta hydrolase [Mycobacterium yunnanensis]